MYSGASRHLKAYMLAISYMYKYVTSLGKIIHFRTFCIFINGYIVDGTVIFLVYIVTPDLRTV